MRRFGGALAAIVVLAFLHPAKADIFLLRSGGHIEGDLVNADQKPRTTYEISLAGGGQITLDAEVVEKVQAQRPELAEYEKMRRQAEDTVLGQLKLAEWCRDHNLTAQRKAALDRVIQLDPDNADARRLLGYRKVKDRWMTREEEMADKGYVQSRSPSTGLMEWITPQEAENRNSQQKQLKSEAAWRAKIRAMRQLLDGNRPDSGRSGLKAISDPMAIIPLAERLNGDRKMSMRKDPRDDARQIYVEVLARFDMPQARAPLAICALEDPSEEIRLSCLDELEKQKDDAVTHYFEGRMSDKKASDDVIDRAGVALGRIKNPRSVETLVKYVAYERIDIIPTNNGGPGAMTTTFNKNGGGGGGLSMNTPPKKIRRLVECRGVLDALRTITGQDFGYDSVAWQRWYKNQIAKGGPIAKPN